ncbi:hypothetical protein ABBQ32_013842 [Trebouxia sp. C0010 RCD-2024]
MMTFACGTHLFTYPPHACKRKPLRHLTCYKAYHSWHHTWQKSEQHTACSKRIPQAASSGRVCASATRDGAIPGIWDPDDYMQSYDSDDYDNATYFQLRRCRAAALQKSPKLLFETGADRREKTEKQKRKKELQAQISEMHPALTLLLLMWRSFWFRFLTLWRKVRATPLETCRAVVVTSQAAKDVVQEMFIDSVDRARHAVEEARAVAERSRAKAELMEDRPCPDDVWGRVHWWWERPQLKRMRTTVSMAQWSVKLPALLALVATQVGLLASQVSLPMLAPLLLGTGMLFRSIKSNASFLFPRIGLVVVLMWVLWFANSVVQSTVHYLQRQGALDHRVSAAVITGSELFTMLGAGVIVLSALGVNVSGLLLPAGVCLAIAAKDLAHNFLAGFFLFAVQPFRLGDRIAVRSMASGESAASSPGPTGGWYEGSCEQVDLRYTIIKNGRQRLYMPNSKFLTSEFMVLDAKTKDKRGRRPGSGGRRSHQAERPTQQQQQPQADMTRPLGPGMAHSMWGEELQRQRIMSASRRPIPSSNSEEDSVKFPHDQQASASGPPGNQASNDNGHQPPKRSNGDAASQSPQQNGAQRQEPPRQYLPPYRGIPGYYTYQGAQYDPAVQDQYLYQYNYNGLHPFWRNAYRHEDDDGDDEQWDESRSE